VITRLTRFNLVRLCSGKENTAIQVVILRRCMVRGNVPHSQTLPCVFLVSCRRLDAFSDASMPFLPVSVFRYQTEFPKKIRNFQHSGLPISETRNVGIRTINVGISDVGKPRCRNFRTLDIMVESPKSPKQAGRNL